MPSRVLWLITFLLTVVCWGILVIAYLSVSNQVHATQSDVKSTFDLLGVPLVEAFRVNGRLGLKFDWGAAVLALAPFVLGLIASLVQVARYTSTHTRPAVDQD